VDPRRKAITLPSFFVGNGPEKEVVVMAVAGKRVREEGGEGEGVKEVRLGQSVSVREGDNNLPPSSSSQTGHGRLSSSLPSRATSTNATLSSYGGSVEGSLSIASPPLPSPRATHYRRFS
jgi:hypothetical protein